MNSWNVMGKGTKQISWKISVKCCMTGSRAHTGIAMRTLVQISLIEFTST
jgi:hypothetical protein